MQLLFSFQRAQASAHLPVPSRKVFAWQVARRIGLSQSGVRSPLCDCWPIPLRTPGKGPRIVTPQFFPAESSHRPVTQGYGSPLCRCRPRGHSQDWRGPVRIHCLQSGHLWLAGGQPLGKQSRGHPSKPKSTPRSFLRDTCPCLPWAEEEGALPLTPLPILRP